MDANTPLNGAADKDPADEVAAAEAELKAAQERLDAARAKAADKQASPAQTSSAQASPIKTDEPSSTYAVGPDTTYQTPPSTGYVASGYGVPSAGTAPPPYGAPPSYFQGYQPYQQPYAPPSYTQPVTTSKDHVAAGLLAIFLGWLGIHKFYLGYNTSGFIMLAVSIIGGLLTITLATWVIWIIAIIEGIMYLVKSQTDFEQLYVVHRREWF